MRLYYDERNIVRLASTTPIITNIYKHIDVEGPVANPIGKRIVFGGEASGGMRVAVVCNWGDACGIATYTQYLVDALLPRVEALRVFAERGRSVDSRHDVSYCWRRGESMRAAIAEVLDWGPSVVLVQHEYGIFPKAPYLMQMCEMLHDTPYVVTMHSVYEHLDKTVASSAMKNIIVHTDTGRECLARLGNGAKTWTIPHGCVVYDGVEELWNTWDTPYAIVQFGFGFAYKGVEVALEAIAEAKRRQPEKYRDIFYTYFCAESPHVKNVISEYARKIQAKIRDLGLQDNAAIIRGYQSDQSLENILRTAKLALFPYVTDPKNVVYGASGAVRIAMANQVPTIASSSHMFDDMEGVLPRPTGAAELADEIDRVFSNSDYRQGMLYRSSQYIRENSWDATALRYLSVLQEVRENYGEDVIFI